MANVEGRPNLLQKVGSVASGETSLFPFNPKRRKVLGGMVEGSLAVGAALLLPDIIGDIGTVEASTGLAKEFGFDGADSDFLSMAQNRLTEAQLQQRGDESIPGEYVPPEKVAGLALMTNKDGTPRIVALAALSPEDIKAGIKKPVRRVCQLNKQIDGSWAWADYVPQKFWGGGDTLVRNNKLILESLQDENLALPDRETLAPPLSFPDGTPVPMGWVGDIYSSLSMDRGETDGYYQAYILGVKALPSEDASREDRIAVVWSGIPLPDGDWHIVPTLWGGGDDKMNHGMVLDTVSPNDFDHYRYEPSMPLSLPDLPCYQIVNYFIDNEQSLIGTPIIHGVTYNSPYYSTTYTDKEDLNKLVGSLKRGVPDGDIQKVYLINNPLMISDKVCTQIKKS